MEKLERVLAVEEEARQAVGDAVDQAARIRAAAIEAARTLEADAAAESVKAVAAQRDEILSVARAEAERVTVDSEAARTAANNVARARLDSVVAALATGFEG